MPDKKSFLLRLDAKPFEELKRWAGAELRSVNGQIEFILRQAARRHQGRDSPEDTDPAT